AQPTRQRKPGEEARRHATAPTAHVALVRIPSFPGIGDRRRRHAPMMGARASRGNSGRAYSLVAISSRQASRSNSLLPLSWILMPVIQEIADGGVPVKIYTGEIEPQAREQLLNVARLPIVHHHVAAMPDVHLGIGATVGSVIPTVKAVI